MEMIIAIITGLAVILMIVFGALLFCSALLEPRPARPYNRTPASEDLPNYNHLVEKAAFLIAEGFTPVDFARQTVGTMKGTFALWISRDSLSVASLGVSKLAGKPFLRTQFFSQLPDGRYLMTTDGSDPGEFSGMIVAQNNVGARMEVLLKIHQNSLLRNTDVVPWPAKVRYEALNDLHQARAERMYNMKYVRWAHYDHKVWRYSMRGAFKVTVWAMTNLFSNADSDKSP